jgi:hypothetical protein
MKVESPYQVVRERVALLIGALLMSWPALYNGYPLLYPDSVTYLGDGSAVAQAIFLHRFSEYYGMRSFIYSLGILPWHWNITPWPIVVLNTLLAAYVLLLVVRSVVPRRLITDFVAIVLVLSVFTSLSWFASLIMPDILGPISYLGIYLLVFARAAISRREHLIVGFITWWGISSHATHWMLAAGVCLFCVMFSVFGNQLGRGATRAVGEVAAIVLLAAGVQITLHTYLYGEPSLNGERPPFLMARVIADGPGRWYLETHCGESDLIICRYVHNLPTSLDEFLWKENGIWDGADDDIQRGLRAEELRFVIATIRTYPRAQLSRSMANFGQQLLSFGLWNIEDNAWMHKIIGDIFPEGRRIYEHSKQARNSLPLRLFTTLQKWALALSLVAVCARLLDMENKMSPQLVGLFVVIPLTITVNALITGALSMVEDRFEARIIWLLPLLGGLCVLDMVNSGGNERCSGGWFDQMDHSGRLGDHRNATLFRSVSP